MRWSDKPASKSVKDGGPFHVFAKDYSLRNSETLGAQPFASYALALPKNLRIQ